jgi:NAD(P)-dependent dehydrogenase (short-subunit alcohol dehydrogenase family)
MTELPAKITGGCVVVIGGSGSLGQAICEDFARQGRSIAFTFRNSHNKAAALESSLARLGAESLADAVDVTQPEAIFAFMEAVQERFGSIGAAVYAVGPDIAQPYVGDITQQQWQEVIDTDVGGFFSVAKAVIPVFRTQRDGALIAITTAATRHYPARDALSAVPKAAIEQLVVAIAKEEGRFGIRANCVAPGMIDSGLGARMLGRDYDPTVSDTFLRSIPLRRFGTCADISSVVTFLASSDARYISGQTIAVDGGWQL